MIVKKTLQFTTKPGISFKDITSEVDNIVNNSDINIGLVNVFLTSTTSGLFINENESSLLKDIENILSSLISEGGWKHDSSWGEGNAHSHLRSIFLGNQVTIPVKNSSLQLGTWQKIFLIELDVRSRNRTIEVTVYGESEK